jgi:hypothetical protein
MKAPLHFDSTNKYLIFDTLLPSNMQYEFYQYAALTAVEYEVKAGGECDIL